MTETQGRPGVTAVYIHTNLASPISPRSVLIYKPAANYAVAASKSSIVLYYLSSYSAGPVGSLSLTPGYWHHITVTAYQQDVSFYVNGTFVYAVGLGSSVVDQSGDILIGQGYGGKVNYLLLSFAVDYVYQF